MTSVSASHIILTPTQPVGSRQPQRESNPGPPHQELPALPTELLRPHQELKTMTFGKDLLIDISVLENSDKKTKFWHALRQFKDQDK